VLRITRSCLARLPEVLDPVMAGAAQESASEPDAQGWVEVAVPVESSSHTVAELLKLGAEAEILAPAGLRERMIDTLRTMAAVYTRPGQA
jgi:predicted DNA-binding transcriptional regulator YafY